MASLIPNEISTSLNETVGNIGQFFTNVQDVVQTVSSVYDQVTGKSQGLEGQAQITTPAPVPAPSAPSPAAGMSSTVMIAIGAAVVVGLILVLK